MKTDREMTDQTEKLKALALAATPGPWRWVNPDNDQPRQPGEWRASLRTIEEFPSLFGPYTLPKFIVEADEIRDENMDANADYIAAANPAVVLELIADNERLRAELAVQAARSADPKHARDAAETMDHAQLQALGQHQEKP